ncbi:histidine phosphatase family protein [Clostridium butyricum]|jgi:probable phosphoglycerate mutase|uniref:Histidine phosphatase family protein n=1 Tax=Clostridium butyricum TaxID=1492 RepID=A0A512TM17_CLOBU|nr:histidine phosphatase family protein [Clostridium butyricum]ETI90466.1 MAG: putative phosphoglycerate mutase [Clostridium butyricum DORA_1]MDU1004597.1 histidine phosphatase family protein [Clostridium butyricum]MDU1507619.1 histidine phosphatase family protein [Clostridium butyricum]MDU4659966.1 histidine phosphatase family protein [Clostridium butyricum]MDU4800627.1 histidine phosphatase family protein [Clostridium butyricum]
MKTTIMLIRHGETEWNILGKFQGSTDIPLSNEGIRQAFMLKERLKSDFDYIFSSPLKRAYETAKILCDESGKHVSIAEEIREINFGKWEGLTVKGIAEKYPDIFNEWRNDKREGKFCGGDMSTLNASIRAKNCIMEIANKHKGKKIVIVAHGGIIKAGLIGIFEWDMSMYHKIALGNTCVNTITFNDDMKPALLGLNDTNHLDCEVTQV